MRCILACPDDFLWRLVADSGEPRLDPLYLVESARARTRIVQRGGEALTGDLEREGLYRRAFRTGHEPVLLAVERARQARIVAAIRRVAPEAPIVALAEDRVPGGEPEGVIALAMDAVTERFVEPALERALTRARVERVRAHFASAERVLIMMQDDPDPDAIASALALRAVLGRNKTAAPIATFGTITRPASAGPRARTSRPSPSCTRWRTTARCGASSGPICRTRPSTCWRGGSPAATWCTASSSPTWEPSPIPSSSRSSRTSSCRWRARNGRSCPAPCTASCTSPCATSAGCGRPATWCATRSGTSAPPAAIGRWPRP